MKRNILVVMTMVLCALFSKPVYSQTVTTIPSTDGYYVNISISAVSIVPTSSSCVNGYNYNVNIHYVITFTGSHIPSGLWTLQGNLGCGANTHFYSLPVSGGTGNVTSVSNVWNPNHDCATATPATLFCNTTTINIQGPGIPSQTVLIPLVQAGVLPVSIINFGAEAQKDKVKIGWSTVSEINNDYFTVERSSDANTWSTVKTIKGAVNSATLLNYDVVDNSPVTGASYYRLKQVDLNGKTSYSNSVMVKYSTGNNISAYPVPNTGNIVNFKGIEQPKNMQLLLRDAAGTTVYIATLSANSIDLPVIKPGIYTISLNNKATGDVTNLRYVKL